MKHRHTATESFVRALWWWHTGDRELAAAALRNALLDAGPCA